MDKKIIFTPELVLNLNISANQTGSKVEVKTASDAITVLEGIKEMTDNHLVLIFLNDENVVTGVDTFLRDMHNFNREAGFRALKKTIANTTENDKDFKKVIIAQTIPDTSNPALKDVDIVDVADIAGKILYFGDIELVDCILIGQEGYFSFREDAEAWKQFEEKLSIRKKFMNMPE